LWNNRQPSKAAFDIFKKIELTKVVGIKGRSEIYELTGHKPEIQNLDSFFTHAPTAPTKTSVPK
jgi:hypothetical protein